MVRRNETLRQEKIASVSEVKLTEKLLGIKRYIIWHFHTNFHALE